MRLLVSSTVAETVADARRVRLTHGTCADSGAWPLERLTAPIFSDQCKKSSAFPPERMSARDRESSAGRAAGRRNCP